MGQLRFNLAESAPHNMRTGSLAKERALFRPAPRQAAVEAIARTRAFRGLFFASLMAAAFWTAVAVLILQMR